MSLSSQNRNRFLIKSRIISIVYFFFFNDTPTTEIYPLPLHDPLPIFGSRRSRAYRRTDDGRRRERNCECRGTGAFASDRHCHLGNSHHGQAGSGPAIERPQLRSIDRKSTRLNSSHSQISYAVFCLKKK